MWPAYIGVIGGVVLFALVFVPALIVQVRRYGSLSLVRLLGTAALAVYAVALVAYTLLPLPTGDLSVWCVEHGVSGAQLNPLQFIDDIRSQTAGMGITAAAASRVVLQVVFNVLLFIPFGLFMRRFVGRGVVFATVAAFAVSAAIEATQYTGIWGLIGCSYRVADVDDLIANTLGGLLGALIAPLALAWMPQSRDLARRRLTPRPVTARRRWAGMLIDAFGFVISGAVLVIGWRMVMLGLGRDLGETHEWTEWALQFAVPWSVVFAIPPAIGSGASWGQRAVWLVPVRRDGRGLGPVQRFGRAWIVGGLWAALQCVQAAPPVSEGWSDRASIAAVLIGAAAVVAVVCTRDRRGLSGMMTGARIVDAREGEDDDDCGQDAGSAIGAPPADRPPVDRPPGDRPADYRTPYGGPVSLSPAPARRRG